MTPFAILCLDNNPVTLDQFRIELQPFASKFDVYLTYSLQEAQQSLEFAQQKGQELALVIASQHDDLDGVSFLIQLNDNAHTKRARRILISCGSDVQAIVSAVNEGRLDHCLTHPLPDKQVLETAKKELTQFVIRHDNDNILTYSQVLDHQALLRSHIENKMRRYREGFITDHHKLSDQELADKVISTLTDHFSNTGDEQNAIRQYSKEHVLTSEGRPNRFLWFVTSGRIALFKKDEFGDNTEVVRFGKGNLVGGMSFVTGEPSFSTGITLEPTSVIKLDREDFARVMHSNTDLLPLFTNLLLRHFNRRLQRSITTKIELQKTLDSLNLAQEQLVEREKMAVLGQLIAGVAHEINNPIAAILRGSERITQSLESLFASRKDLIDPQEIHVLRHGLYGKTRSTSEERQAAKQLTQLGVDKSVAKKLIKLGLDDDKQAKTLTLPELHALECFGVIGNTLRSLNVCSNRIAEMVKSLKGYARQDDETFRLIDIHEGLEDTLLIFENSLKRHKIERHYGEIPQIYGQVNALQQIWTNLIANAIDAFPEQGVLTIETQPITRNQEDWILVSFRDNGCGIPKHMKDNIFDLNFTTKKEGNFGLGIGLSVCQQIANQHGGIIDVESEPNQFTLMRVMLPITLNSNL